MPWRELDWLGIIVRFICGALFGAVLVFFTYFYIGINQHPMRWFIGVAAGIGLASAIFGDDFWQAIGDWGVSSWWWW